VRVLLVVYDNGSHVSHFPIGLGYVAAALRNDGHDVVVYNQDVHHYPDAHLTAYLDANRFDMVGISFVGGYYQYRKALALSAAINASRQRPFYVIGGHGPSPEPEYFLRKTGADAVVIGEGEITACELAEAVEFHSSLDEILGIAFRVGDAVRVNPRRPLVQDVDSIALPAYDLFPMEHYRIDPPWSARGAPTDFTGMMLSGRGCTFHCNFCYRLDEGFRPRSNEAIIAEIRHLQERWRINHVLFYDELLMSSEARTRSLCQSFIEHGLKVQWDCNGRLNYAKPALLDLMRRAGCVFINYGIESFDDAALKAMGKALTTKQIVAGVEATLAAGIGMGPNIIWGNIGETRDTLKKGVDFLLKYDDGSQFRTIRPVTPYPGSPLYYYAIQQGTLKDCADFYENKHTNSDLAAVQFTGLSDAGFHEALLEANTQLIENYYRRKVEQTIGAAERLYRESDPAFRGFRPV
jgi:radical SAM superfamily enzyme YgiQ (UPF0313 family)